jgi:predicted protein tyrosine phosphatase
MSGEPCREEEDEYEYEDEEQKEDLIEIDSLQIECVIKPAPKPKLIDLSKYSPRLYLGNLAVLSDSKSLEQAGITHIFTVMHKPVELVPNSRSAICQHTTLIRNDTVDQMLLFDFLPMCRWIHSVIKQSRRNRLLVHCHQGISRSVSFVLAYWMWSHRRQPEDYRSVDWWLDRLCRLSPSAKPNPSFMIQLCDFNFWLFCPRPVSRCIFQFLETPTVDEVAHSAAAILPGVFANFEEARALGRCVVSGFLQDS